MKPSMQNKLIVLKDRIEELNKEFVYEDVFEFEDLPDNTIRLSASTIEQLFKDTNYDLEDVRKKN